MWVRFPPGTFCYVNGRGDAESQNEIRTEALGFNSRTRHRPLPAYAYTLSETSKKMVRRLFRIASTETSPLSGEALYKNQVQRLIDIRAVSAEKEQERRLQMCVVGVGVCRGNAH
jgi:hypothetical protein